MPLKAMLQLTLCRWREFVREPSAFLFVLLMPLMWMVVLGFTIGDSELRPIHLGFDGAKNNPLVAALREIPMVKILPGDESQQMRLLRSGKISAIIRGDNGRLDSYLDPSNQEAVRDIFVVEALLRRKLITGNQPMIFETHAITIPGNRYVDYLIPGLLALSMFSTSLFGTGMTIVSNRRENLLKRFLATPMRPWMYILSHLLGRMLIGLVEIFCILTTGYLFFDFWPQASLLVLVPVLLLASICSAILAITLGSRLKSTGAYNGIMNLIFLPSMMLGGVWFSRSYFPGWLERLTDYLPLSAMVDVIRELCIEGKWEFASSAFWLMMGYTVFFSLVASRRFRWN